jgi:hypothetical protein
MSDEVTLGDLKDEGIEADASKENAPQWKGKADGDQLAGTLKTIEMATTEFGDSHVLNIEDEDGKLWALWLGKVLLDKFLKDAPPIDALVVVTFKGKIKSPKTGFTYNSYDMRCNPKGDFAAWMEARERFTQLSALRQEAAQSGSRLAPDSGDGMAAPF